ncbi:MAG: PilZ domain-containing protein [Myxococcota bacterium]
MHSHDPGAVLLLGFASRRDAFLTRLRQMGFAVLGAESLDAAAGLLRAADPAIGAVLLPSPLPLREPAQALRLLVEVSPAPSLRFVVLGEAPEAGERSSLRQLGPGFVLSEPFTEAELRFVVNHVLYNPTQGEGRRHARVPTRMVAQITGGAGEKDVLVYSLSVDGAFLETRRPSQPGTTLDLALPLPSGLLHTEARVLAANVPGSAYRRQTPKGMGVRFDSVTPEQRDRLEQYLEMRARSFQL